ncbi:hypothetical protein AGOR_G00073400 [Albula goreensis]|uniref:SPIN-DOC-like zinc-finger domain-containing protein n=1 Tax=Albula goreensis TaxID=1534307 RepID=A0A8T3DM48_9TELE|nr:hypothetical protein AGOR_G00073400 [Albula goreensis]
MDSMQNSSSLRTQRYRPASEFDEATLVRKREYWRIKKREQRAKLSLLKKERLTAANTRTCKSRASTRHLTREENRPITVPLAVPAPTLLNSDGTYQTGSQPKKSSHQVGTEKNANPPSVLCSEQSTAGQSHVLQDGQSVTTSQKDRWFQKIKLNNVLPQFPATSSDSRNNSKGAGAGRKAIVCSSTSAASGTFPSAKLNGVLLDSCSQVPPVQIKVQPTSVIHCEDQDESVLLNGPTTAVVPHHNPILHTSDIPEGMKATAQSLGQGASQSNVPEIPLSTQMEVLESMIKKEVDDALQDTDSPITANSNNQAVFPKTEELSKNEAMERVAATDQHRGPKQFSKATVWRQKLQDGSERWGVVRFRIQRQRLLESQRIVGQRNARRTLSPAMALTTRNAQKRSMEESEEERMARKREYWRIKKREQRAKLSVEVKAKMKERDSLLRRVKRYQSILNEMRKARTGSNKARQLSGNGNALSGDTEAIGGFIKEDGTMTVNVPQVSADHRLSGEKMAPDSHTFPHKLLPGQPCVRGNSMLTKQVHITTPPPLKCATQMKVTSHPSAVSSSNPPQLVSNRLRPASHTIPNNTHNPHSTVPKTNISLRRMHNVQSTYPRLTLVKQRHSLPQISRAAGKYPATHLEGQGSKSAGFALQGVTAGLGSPAMAPNLLPELTEEERMAKKREYWRIKKREQRAKRSARAKQALSQCKYSTVIQKQQIQRTLSARRTAGLSSFRSISANCTPNNALLSKPDVPVTVLEKQGNIKQEEEPASTGDACPGSDPPLCQEIKSCLSPPTEQQGEQDLSASMDSQATTLLAVASMKKLLEESLSSVADCNDLQPCKTEQVSSEEEVAEVDVKPSLQCPSAGGDEPVLSPKRDHSASGSRPQSPDLHCHHAHSPSCKQPPLVSQNSSSQSSSGSQTSSESPSLNKTHSFTLSSSQLPIHTPSCSHATSSGHPLQLRRAQRLRTKRIGHNCCSPEPPKQLETATPQPDDDLLRKKREYWRIAKREQRAKKAAREKEMRRQGERGRQLIARATQGATVCMVKTHKAESQNEGHNLHSSPALQTTNSTPILLSSAPGTLTCIKGVTTLPILKVVNSTPVIQGHCSGTLKSKIPAKDPMGTSVRQLVADSQVSFNCSNLPFPVGGNSLDAAMSGGIENTGQLLLMESQQNTPLGSSPESSQVKRWRLQVKHSADIPSSKSASTSKNTSLVHSQAPPSYNIPLRAKQKDACKPLESPKQTQTPEQLEEDLLRKKREYWRVKKKEQRARKAAREREMKRQGATGGWRPILPAKEASRSLEPEGQVSRQWFNSELKDSQLLPSASSEAEFSVLPQLCPPGAVKDELQIDLEAGHEEDEEEEDGHSDSPLSEAAWRTRFLMDFDPLNQLLVCMVCGELQHSHSLETVRGHIEEAHPDTLSMDPQDRRRILEAWDEQVFLRERFFSNQLQQHSSTLTGESQESPAEVEVLVDLEESPALKNGKASKTKSPKKL